MSDDNGNRITNCDFTPNPDGVIVLPAGQVAITETITLKPGETIRGTKP